jgi:peptidoglycan hydrolase-like protein with peptidoglycan-binding domain
MRKNRLISRAMFIGGTVALLAGPAWSQEAPGERRQPDKTLTRPGDNEDVPGIRGQGTVELSKDDMRKVEEALKAKGYNPGKIDGVVDDTNRAAIRSFQKDKTLPVTGIVDNRTAQELGVKISKASDSPGTKGTPKSEGRSEGRTTDDTVPQDKNAK